MTTHIEQEAETEAAEIRRGVFLDGNPFSNVEDAWSDGFIEGYIAGATRPEPPVTDAEVEAAVTGMLATNMFPIWWAANDGGVTPIARAVVRVALEAARATREGKNRNG